MWLTLHFSWSVYLCVYIYAPTGGGPCLPPIHCAIARMMQRHGVWWEQQLCVHPPDHTKYVSYQWVTCLRQLLWNQLPLLVVCEKVRMSQQGCVAMPMLIIPYPQGGWWFVATVQRWTVWNASCEFSAGTSEYLQYSCSHAGNDRRRGSRMRTKIATLYLILRLYKKYLTIHL